MTMSDDLSSEGEAEMVMSPAVDVAGGTECQCQKEIVPSQVSVHNKKTLGC